MISSVYIIKQGTCELISEKMPLRHGENDLQNGAEKSYIHLKSKPKESMCLGLNQGTMTKATRQFTFAEVSEGSWLGEEAILSE
jgi:hypothetical protein